MHCLYWMCLVYSLQYEGRHYLPNCWRKMCLSKSLMSSNRYWAAHDSLTPEMIGKSFQKCGISYAMDATDNDMLWEDRTDDAFDTNTTDMYNDVMTHEQAVQLIDKADREDEFGGFQWRTLVLIWDWLTNKNDWLLCLLVCLLILLDTVVCFCAELVYDFKKFVLVVWRRNPMTNWKSHQQVFIQFSYCFLFKSTDNSQTFLWQNWRVQYDSFQLHLA